MTLESSGSIGVACWPEHAEDVSALIMCADIAMYEAKTTSEGIATYHEDPDDHSLRRLSLASQLRCAIESDELMVYYQPKARLSYGKIIGVEALARWRHVEHGMIPPEEPWRLGAHRSHRSTGPPPHRGRAVRSGTGRVRALCRGEPVGAEPADLDLPCTSAGSRSPVDRA
jgi:hypothetical protein